MVTCPSRCRPCWTLAPIDVTPLGAESSLSEDDAIALAVQAEGSGRSDQAATDRVHARPAGAGGLHLRVGPIRQTVRADGEPPPQETRGRRAGDQGAARDERSLPRGPRGDSCHRPGPAYGVRPVEAHRVSRRSQLSGPVVSTLRSLGLDRLVAGAPQYRRPNVGSSALVPRAGSWASSAASLAQMGDSICMPHSRCCDLLGARLSRGWEPP